MTEHPVVAFIRARLDEWAHAVMRWPTSHVGTIPLEAQALATVAALRAVLDLHEPATDHTGKTLLADPRGGAFGRPNRPHPGCVTCGVPGEWYHHEWPCETLLALTAIWSDHPDYQEQWKP